jgi:ribosomal protein S18 acetylase RimI-like enzyme
MPTEADPSRLKRETAGRYRTADGRFTVEQASGRWLVTDEAQHDELGLPLVRGPFATLDEARGAVSAARSEPSPTSRLAERIAAIPRRAPRANDGRPQARPPARRSSVAPAAAAKPPELREFRAADGPALRALWREVGLHSLGDDDASLATLAERNAGLVRVATAGDRIVASALGAWDGRRGWIYHVATAPDHRGTGLARRLVRDIERRLRELGCRKVNVIVRDDNAPGADFWARLGYSMAPARQFGKEL